MTGRAVFITNRFYKWNRTRTEPCWCFVTVYLWLRSRPNNLKWLEKTRGRWVPGHSLVGVQWPARPSCPPCRVICLCAQFEVVLQHGLRKSRGLALTAAALKQAAGFSSKTDGGTTAWHTFCTLLFSLWLLWCWGELLELKTACRSEETCAMRVPELTWQQPPCDIKLCCWEKWERGIHSCSGTPTAVEIELCGSNAGGWLRDRQVLPFRPIAFAAASALRESWKYWLRSH